MKQMTVKKYQMFLCFFLYLFFLIGSASAISWTRTSYYNVTVEQSNYSNYSNYSGIANDTNFWDLLNTPLDFIDAKFLGNITIGDATTTINGTRITTEELFASNICYSNGTNCTISSISNYVNGSGNGSLYGGYISKFKASRTITDSQIWDDDYSVKIGTQEGSEKFIVNGSTRVTNLNTSGFIMPTGANNNYCLKTDENGTASWQSCGGLLGGQIFHLPVWTGLYTIGNSRFVEQTDGIVGIASDNSSEPIPFVFKINSTDGHTVIGEGPNWNERYLLTTQKTIGNMPDEFVGIFNRIALNLTSNSSQNINGIISMIDYSQDYTLNGTMMVSSLNTIANNGNGTIGSEYNPIIATVGTIENNQFGYIPMGFGSLGAIRNVGSGKIDIGIGLYGTIENSGNGNITNAISIFAGQVENSGNGNIENAYGLVIADQSGIGNIYSRNLYSEGNNSENVFDGNIDIGGNITVQGNLKIQGKQGLTVNKLILKDVNLIALTKTYCWLNYTSGLLTSSDC